MKQPTLVLLTSERAVVYEGRKPIATYDIVEPLSAEDVEAIRTSDLPLEAEPA